MNPLNFQGTLPTQRGLCYMVEGGTGVRNLRKEPLHKHPHPPKAQEFKDLLCSKSPLYTVHSIPTIIKKNP